MLYCDCCSQLPLCLYIAAFDIWRERVSVWIKKIDASIVLSRTFTYSVVGTHCERNVHPL